jgi:parallel beta-helix repeat protein
MICGCLQISAPSPQQAQKSSQATNPIEVSGPMSITQPGYYQLSKDLTPIKLNRSKSGSCACFFIRSSDVVFDGMGHVIDGSKTAPYCPEWSDGFYFSDKGGAQSQYPNVAIRNITIVNWSGGVELSGVQNFLLEDATVMNNKNGVMVHSSSNVTFSHNNITLNTGMGIWGRNNEYITIDHNSIENNPRYGIYLDGQQDTPPEISILGNRIVLYQFLYYKKTTSGNGYVLSDNRVIANDDGITIRNSGLEVIEKNYIGSNKGTGLELFNIDNSVVRDNVIKNHHETGIHKRGRDSNLVLANNTFSGNNKDIVTDYDIGQLSFSVIIGTLLVFLLKILAGASNIFSKFESARIYTWLKARSPLPEEKTRSARHKSRLLVLFESAVGVSVLGAIILGGVFTYSTSFGLKPEVFLILSVIGGIVIVIPKAVQYLIAKRMGMQAGYRMWWGGILIMILTTVLFRYVFGQPVRTDVTREESFDTKILAYTRLAGPVVSVLLSLVFLLLYLMKGTFASLALMGSEMSLLTALVTFLPISPMDGEQVFKWNKLVWIVVFVPILLAYGYFIILH